MKIELIRWFHTLTESYILCRRSMLVRTIFSCYDIKIFISQFHSSCLNSLLLKHYGPDSDFLCVLNEFLDGA